MKAKRLTILKHFTIDEGLKLLMGKLFFKCRGVHFNDLQDRENKLTIILQADPAAYIGDNEVVINYCIDSKDYQFYLRLKGSDVWVFNQVIINNSYYCVIKMFASYFGKAPKSIIDAGANVGMSVLYFKAKHPDLNIIAIEPDSENFNYARKNVLNNHLNYIILHQAALWPTKTKMEVVNDFRDRNDWSLRVEENIDGQIISVTPHEMILSLNGEVDIFKIDIEGGEAELFRLNSDLDWLFRVKMIAIEIHNEFDPEGTIISRLNEYGFKISNHGELTIGINAKYSNAIH